MEVKYKVWDEENKRMLLLSDEELGTVVLFDKVGVSVYLQDGTELSKFKILPYTGVKDINKKDAYLGDILKDKITEWSSQKDKEKAANSFGIVKKEISSNNLYIEWNFRRKYQGEYYWDTNNLPITHIKQHEVIGNVFENKDMIKKEV